MKRIGAMVGALVLVLLLVPSMPATAAAPASATAPAGVEDFHFESFGADYFLSLDDAGYVHTRVVETIVAVFPPQQNRGIIRAIPDESRGYPLHQQMLSITDEDGDPVYFERYETSEYDVATETYVPFVEYWLGTDDYVEGRTTYVLEYSIDSTINHFDEGGGVDEFYWDVNGNGWPQSFDEVTARIHLSPALRDALQGRTSCFTGEYGTDGTCSLHRTDDGFQVTVAPVYGYSTVTVSVVFDGGTVTQRERPQDSWIVQLAPKLILGLIALLVIAGLVIRNSLWLGPRRGIIIAQYDPPAEHVLLSAEIVDRPYRALSAQLIDFAVRGILRIADLHPESTATDLKNRYQLQLVDASTATPKELRVLTLLFGKQLDPGTEVNPGKLDQNRGASLYGLTAESARQADKEGYKTLPDDRLPKLLRRIAGLAVLLFIPIWVYAFSQNVPDTGPITLFMWLSIAGWIVLAIVLVRPRRLTAKGAAARDYLLGMREYLTVAEEDRMRMLQSPQGAQRRIDPSDRDAVVHLYERLLPYAVLWGVEQQWAEQLRVRYQEATPTWLAGSTLNTSFVDAFTYSALTNVHPVVTSSSSGGSSWSSSGGSSFSSGSFGGGFSGGGGGGGGGGGR